MHLRLPRERSMIDLLRDRAAEQPDECAFTFLDDGERAGASITWGVLERRCRAIAAAIAKRVDPGARVLVLFPPSTDFIPAFFGVLYAGAIAVPAYPPGGASAERAHARLRGMTMDAGITLAVGSATDSGLCDVPWLDPAMIDDAEAGEWRMPKAKSSSVAFLQYTSGSTSEPRGVMVTHGNLLHNLAQTHADGRYGHASIGVSWLPVNHDMGLINGVLQPVFSGFPAYLMPPAAFLQRPARWLEAISRLGATHSGGPNFAYDLCVRRVSEDEAAALDLGTWQVAYNGSEPVRRATLESFQCRFGTRGFQWQSFSPAYGLAESTLLVASVPAGAPPVFEGDAVASGTIEEDGRILIVDPAAHVVMAPGRVGEIWVSGPSVTRGYWNRHGETAVTFDASIADGRGPFLRTGDLGFIRDGRLFITGRLKDLLIIRGAKHYPQDLELTAEQAHPALRPGCCAAFALQDEGEERVAIVAEVDVRELARGGAHCATQVLTSVRLAIAASHHVAPCSVTLVAAGTIPKTTSGKLQRFLCREALLNDTLNPLASWSDAGLAAARVAS